MKDEVNILDLKPTQFAVGMQEICEKAVQIGGLKKHQLKKFLQAHPISVIIAPNNEKYIIDGHHHTAACWQAGVEKLHIRVLHDFSDRELSYKKFWKIMRKHHWCHLYDKFGDGPRHPMYLGRDIRSVGDDPYRSLAWLVRRQNGFEHSQEAFSEFKWANFFRKHRVFKSDFDLNYEKALKKGLQLAKSRAAKHLPGYNGRKG